MSDLKSALDKWRAQPQQQSAADLAKLQKLWAAVNDYVRAAGGWVTSLPGIKLVRIEAPQGSPLADKLRELGYTVNYVGDGTRLSPFGSVEQRSSAVHYHAGFVPVDIFEIELKGR